MIKILEIYKNFAFWNFCFLKVFWSFLKISKNFSGNFQEFSIFSRIFLEFSKNSEFFGNFHNILRKFVEISRKFLERFSKNRKFVENSWEFFSPLAKINFSTLWKEKISLFYEKCIQDCQEFLKKVSKYEFIRIFERKILGKFLA